MLKPAYASVLAAGRDQYNARMREARRRYPMLSHDVFRAFLEDAGVIVDAVAPGRVQPVVDSIYDLGLAMTGRTLIGPAARSPVLHGAWRALFPRFATLIAREPAQVLGMLSNAVLHLEAIPGTRLTQWMDDMGALAARVGSVDALRAVGQIAAWRAGAAHFRAGALVAAAGLPPPLALAALHAPDGMPVDALLRQLASDPWWQGVDPHACRARTFGAFTGFGGPFGAPPTVKPDGDGFLVRAGGRAFFLLADACGASLQAATLDEFERAEPGGVPTTLAHAQACANATTVAITSPFTHAIRLEARP
jgi:hypothetical protein